MLSSIRLNVGPKRFLYLLKPSNYKGSALLGIVTKFLGPAANCIVMSRGPVAQPKTSHNFMFRRCSLLP